MAMLGSRLLAAFAAAGLLLLGACAREDQDQMSWARAALERNSALEIVAADEKTRTFTVRMKDSGQMRLVRADQVVAGTASETPAAAAPVAAPADTREVSAASATAAEAAPAPAAAAAPAPAEAEAASAEPAAPGGHVLESGPGYSIEAATPARAALSQSGPGYSIKPAAPAGQGNAARTRLRDAGVTSAAIERRREPIVCQGARLLHIDNRNLEFDGDAVSAQDGCEIHITNSHITATGVGLLVRNANVHIDNSLIEGDAGSIDASDGAQVYAADSRFRGLSRRLDTAAFHDLGGNIWN
ncbi:MAG TPA: hypothetical protein VMG33_02350 [Steroidobacteraceae bacterium]|nr:hypothetical protein [Steroidobacteraceae bacterium]